MFKKMISILVSAAMTIGCGTGIMPDIADIAAAVAADEEVLEYDGWQYVLVDGGARLVGVSKDTSLPWEITLPTELDGHKIVSFAAGTFDTSRKVSRVYLPEELITAQYDDNWLENSKVDMLITEDFEFWIQRFKGGSREMMAKDWLKKKKAPVDSGSVPVILETTALSVEQIDVPTTTTLSAIESEPADEDDTIYDVVVPDKIAGHIVNELGFDLFEDAVNLGAVTVPDAVTYLYYSTFSNSSVTSVNIPKSVEFIPDNCFKDCKSLSKIKFHDNLLIVSSTAFTGCPDSLYIPPKYKNVYDTAFSDFTYSDGRKQVGDWMLYFKKYTDPEKEMEIALYSPLNSGDDVKLVIPKEVGGYTINTVLKTRIIENKSFSEVSFEEGVTLIPNLSRSKIKSITFPESVSYIGAVLNECTSLTSVVIPPNIETLSNTFRGCTSLTDIIFEGDEIKIDGSNTFAGTAIKDIEFPGNCIVDISSIPQTITELSFKAGENVTLNGVNKKLKSVSFAPDIKELSISSSCFSDGAIENVQFPNGKVNIGIAAFRRCPNLKELVINGDADIEANAFMNCPELEKITIGGKCNIADLAFANCSKLAEIDFDVTNDLSARCFNGCHQLYRINGIDVVPENSCEPADEFRDYFYKNCHTAHEVGFVDRFTMNNVKRVAAETVDDSMSDIEKAKALHDWVCENTVYDGENEDALGNHVDSAVFMDGVAVCEGYAMAYDLLLHEVGIQSAYVCTKDHAWNLVKLGGKWFHADTTWDDGESYSHSWFLCPDSDMTADIRKGYDISAPSYLHDFQPSELPVCDTLMGDVNGDGMVDSKDATDILAEYSRLSTGADAEFDELQAVVGDVSVDGRNDSMDASKILSHYSVVSTGGTDSIMN